ncbi:MAG: hypothetical protein OEZ01_11740 [Candidatus Heimdallarchaeota archaeon]|nr:hypothetical protein [Candidatus Heimdallarchaeota archaeon]MDH5646675.1 hypothetical protein [Candidatus Heimdallarchaeota archaeon]
MKSLTTSILSGVIILLLGTSLGIGHNDDRNNDNNHMGGGMMDDGHMNGMTENMEIYGEVSVTNAITIEISVRPTEEMQQYMQGEMSQDDYSNQVTVSFTQLVEFEDLNNDGYSSDDVIVSTYQLDENSLTQPELNNNIYTINSKLDNTFQMFIESKFKDNVFYGFKWSLEIAYNFQLNNTKLAMIHTIDTKHGRMMEGHMNGEDNDMNQQDHHSQYEEHRMNDGDHNVPMFFEWAPIVEVDGVNYNITATGFDNIFAISTIQGDLIIYDPIVGVDPDSLLQTDENLSSLFRNFMNSINSPTRLGLMLAGFAILSMVFIALYAKKNN